MAALAVIRAALAGKIHAALLLRQAPDPALCAQIAAEYPHCLIDWVWLAENHDIAANTQHPIAELLNPRGISFYPFSERQHWWVVPPACAHLLYQHFSPDNLYAVNGDLPVCLASPQKPWFTAPQTVQTTRVCIIGGGIAAAASAYALAKRGVAVTVLEQNQIAQAASGNRQGLLYAKISPHDTMQSRLLLQAYGFAAGLLRTLLPQQQEWAACGVLHLDHDAAETQRNHALAAQACALFRYLDAHGASAQAGIELSAGGLWWPHGAWVHPPALVRALLQHPLIEVHEHTRIVQMTHHGSEWQLQAADGAVFSGSHVVLCSGADDALRAPLGISLARIRGQTDNAYASAFSTHLKVALSGKSYISPVWQGAHCFGATFQPKDTDEAVRAADSEANRAQLAQLHPALAASLPTENLPAHAAVRCDAYDHLPVVGAVGDAAAMRRVYAKLALDKNYPLTEACPYVPQLYLNTAHATRGLVTAPLCGEAVAAEILGLPHPFDHALRAALSPNRLIVRDLVRAQ